jgi:hypothetical protein
MDVMNPVALHREPWNKGKLVGQKSPFKLKENWAIRIRLELAQQFGGGVIIGVAGAPIDLAERRRPDPERQLPGKLDPERIGR